MTKGNPAMEKISGENDIKGLEEEIDSAVDRLFVEKKNSQAESLSMDLPIEKPPDIPVKIFDQESSLPRSSEPLPFVRSFEAMEIQLLLLEWEITKENLEKTKKEVLVFRETSKDRPNIISVLNLMDKVLSHMINNEENIQPSQIKFLLDSKETIKLFIKEETSAEINLYRQLALGGIEARFLGLEGVKERKIKEPSLGTAEGGDKIEIVKVWEKEIGGMMVRLNLFFEKMEEILNRFDQHFIRLEQILRTFPGEAAEKSYLPVEIIVLKIDEKFFGIESHQVFKIFRVPNTFQDKYSDKQRIRLKDFEIELVDLNKIFSIESRRRKEEMQLLVVKENGQYKGLIVDHVLKKLSVQMDIHREYNEYCLGMVHWTYQEQLVEVPVLNLKKI